MFIDALDHLAVDEGTGRRTFYRQFDAPLFLDDADIEGLVTIQQFLAVIQRIAAIQHGERTIAKDVV